jgi:hypothetical protein
MGLPLNNHPVRWQRSTPYNNPLLFCHPERSRGICGSTDLSWKCFARAERSAVFHFDARLGYSLTGFFPKIDLAFLRVLINLLQFGIREVEILHRIERVVKLLHVTGSNQC